MHQDYEREALMDLVFIYEAREELNYKFNPTIIYELKTEYDLFEVERDSRSRTFDRIFADSTDIW